MVLYEAINIAYRIFTIFINVIHDVVGNHTCTHKHAHTNTHARTHFTTHRYTHTCTLHIHHRHMHTTQTLSMYTHTSLHFPHRYTFTCMTIQLLNFWYACYNNLAKAVYLSTVLLKKLMTGK